MAINWGNVQSALDKASRANVIRSKMAECSASGNVRIDDNSDLILPYAGAIQTLWDGRAQALIASAKTDLQGA